MNDIDYEKLRKDLIDYFGTAMFSGFGFAIIDVSRVEKANDSELLAIAKKCNFDLNKYKLNKK